MYHEVPRGKGHTAQDYFSVPADRFGVQMARLQDHGLRAVSLESILVGPDSNLVALTFDDGHLTHYEVAYPVLTGLGFTATFFVTTSLVGTEGHMSWTQLREMAEAGMSIQSHTHTHPFLSALDRGAVAWELSESKRLLDEHLGQKTVSLALPGGDAPQPSNSDLIAAAGYRIVATSSWGTNPAAVCGTPNAMKIRRYTVRQDTTLDGFTELAWGRSPYWSREGIRLRVLNEVRRVLGAERYSRWRHAFLAWIRG